MRVHRVVLTILALALLVPVAASAQERGLYVFGGRGMLGIMTEAVPAATPNARQRVVVDVVKDSPAEKAGVAKGDTILSINGLAASQQVMNLPFQPGDTVVLRVRRGGRERDVTVVATERQPARYAVGFPDSIGERMAIIMDRVRASVDTIHFPRIEMRHLDNDSLSVIIIGRDTIRTIGRRGVHVFPEMHPDSIRTSFEIRALPRILGDSLHMRIFTRGDSTRAFRWNSDSTFRWHADSTFMRPYDLLTTTSMLGMRAVAGAELAPLNPGLAQYFGAAEGVLVLNARDGTPAARAGLLAGDVILQVDGTPVTSVPELRRAIERARDRDVTLRVLRSGRQTDVTLTRR